MRPNRVRSAPAQKVPPSPASTATLASSFNLEISKGSASASATAPLTAFRTSGRLMATTKVVPISSVLTVGGLMALACHADFAKAPLLGWLRIGG